MKTALLILCVSATTASSQLLDGSCFIPHTPVSAVLHCLREKKITVESRGAIDDGSVDSVWAWEGRTAVGGFEFYGGMIESDEGAFSRVLLYYKPKQRPVVVKMLARHGVALQDGGKGAGHGVAVILEDHYIVIEPEKK